MIGDSWVRYWLKAQRPRAETADGTRGHFEDEHAACVDAALGMNGTVPQTDRSRASGDAAGDGVLNGAGRGRWRDVQRLFEKRPVERIRLVEDRKAVHLAVMHQS